MLKSYKSHWLWLIIAAICLIAQVFNLSPYLQYHRELISDGQLWRLVTGHIVHVNWIHWGLNVFGLAVIAVLFATRNQTGLWLCVLVGTSLIISGGLYWFSPELIWYVGLSGVLHGLFVFGLLRELPKFHYFGYLLLLLVVVKLIWEYFEGAFGSAEFLSGTYIAVQAHRWGAFAGLLIFLLLRIFIIRGYFRAIK